MSASNPQIAARRLRRLLPFEPRLAIILGSGFGSVVDRLAEPVRIPYAKIPGFHSPGVEGHAGVAVGGHLEGAPVLILSGRVHYYEGHPMEVVTYPVKVLAACGIRSLLLTNAAGGINPRFNAGDFMAVTDHINFTGVNPLRPAKPGKPASFVDLTQVYDPTMTGLLAQAAKKTGVKLRRGVYVGVSGPTFETPAEIRAFSRLGGDAVGMSTVAEAIVARQLGLSVAALSCVTNLAAGLARQPITHEEVLSQGDRAGRIAGELIAEFARFFSKE